MKIKQILHSMSSIGSEEINAVLAVLKSGHLEDGSDVRDLELFGSTYFEKKYCSAVSSGFAAIHLSLIALGISSGDEVILPSYVCSALLNPILMLGATPVIADIGENSFNISVQEVENKITSKTKAIIVPHIFGFPARIDEIVAMGIPVIEDCAQSIGVNYKGKKLGTFGTLGIFSFYAGKMISGGDGGMIITDDIILNKAIKDFRYYGHKKMHNYLAFNYHMTNLPAALVLVQLKRIGTLLNRRNEIARIYESFFKNESRIGIDFENKEVSGYYRYPVRLDCNIEIVKSLMQEQSINCGYGVLEGMHQLLSLETSKFPNTEKNLKTIISLPIYPTLKDTEVQYIAETLIKIIHNQ